jgi:E3 ubiquitin-protein ligase UBR7
MYRFTDSLKEGVMVYNHLKDKVKSFLQPFAESGLVVGAEDIKAYFEKLRGDAEAIKAAGGAALATAASGDNRKEGEGKFSIRDGGYNR